ncbi:MAG: mobilization protein [Rhodospirillaceae bacterium]|nr:mobilization protein [Rhodospirillaceae bacterium]
MKEKAVTKSLEEAEKKFRQAKALVQQLRAREKETARKLDTRRKIVLGGFLIAEAKADPGAMARLKTRIQNLPVRDKQLFENWHVG